MLDSHYPPSGTQLYRFLVAMLTDTVHMHPEFLQRPSHWSLSSMAEDLRALGWPVDMAVRHLKGEIVAFYYIGEASLAVADGEEHP